MAPSIPPPAPLSRRLGEYAGYGVLAFLVIGLYEVARPSAESLFLEAYGSRFLPWVWAAVAPASIVVGHLFGLAARRLPMSRVFALASLTSAVLLVGLLAWVKSGVPQASFALYVWKDVYIVVLVEAFWAHANARVPSADAQWAYGAFTASGTVGGIAAGAVVGPLAGQLGTVGVMGLLVPGLLVVAAAGILLGRTPETRSPEAEKGGGLLEGLQVVKRSRYLLPLLGMVLVSQLVITLVDFSFNHALELRFGDTDQRTGVLGQVYALINTGSLLLQVGTGLVLSLLGVGGTLVGIPFVVGLAVGGHVLVPIWFLLAGAKVASKVFDYSIARAAKEMLYIPLSRAEQTQGKAVVDVMTYRTAKGGAALLVGAAVGVLGASGVEWAALALLIAWVALAVTIARRYRQSPSSKAA